MKICKIILTLTFFFSGISSATAEAKSIQLSREKLLEGCPIPDRREFPMDTKTSPCEDFHQYVCGPVEKSFHLPADRSSWTFSFSDNAEKLLYAKKKYFKFIQEGYTSKNPRARQLKDFFLACMNGEAKTSEEKAYVQKELATIGQLKSRQELQDLMASRFFDPSYQFLDWGSIANQNDPRHNDLYVMTEIMTLPEKSYYENKDLLKDFQKLATAFFKTVGMDQPEKRAESVVEFEKAFAKVHPTPEVFRQRISANMYRSQEDFLKKYPQLRLEKLFVKSPKNTQIRDFAPESLQFLDEKLQAMPLSDLQSLILWHSLSGMMDDAYPEFFAQYFELRKKYLGGPDKRPDRDERCTKSVMHNFGMELDEDLLPILFKNFPEKKVDTLVEKIRESLQQELTENTWLSPEAKKEALRKIAKANLKLVKPRRLKDWDFLPVQKYNAKTPIANSLKLRKAQIEKNLKELKELRNRNLWTMAPLTLNAYYSPSDNQFVLLQGILQSPFFDPKASAIENTAAIGSVTGHELGHAVDDQGSRYDADGKLKQWMTMKDLAEFSHRSEKLVKQFDGIGHNGRLTLGENIGDHVGITSSFRVAFPDEAKASSEDLQKFFISYAKVWCGIDRPEYAKMRLKTDPHALGYARINEQVVHLDGFAKAFACKKGNKMFLDPNDRVRVW